MKVRALKKHYYSRHEYLPGEEFEIDDREAMNVDLLCKLGTLEVIKEKTVAASPTSYQTTAVEPEKSEESEATGEFDPDAPKRRTYRRRDMRPQE